jgi:hypothetical protein
MAVYGAAQVEEYAQSLKDCPLAAMAEGVASSTPPLGDRTTSVGSPSAMVLVFPPAV